MPAITKQNSPVFQNSSALAIYPEQPPKSMGHDGVAFETVARYAFNGIDYYYKFLVTTPIRKTLSTVKNRLIAKRAERLINQLEQALRVTPTSNLPPIHLFELEDGSLFLEWIVMRGRVGFNFEVDHTESGWYILSNDGACQQWGGLQNLNLNWIVDQINYYHN